MRKALVIGIDYYDRAPQLCGCVKDANGVSEVLERNFDGTVNFSVRLITGTDPSRRVTRADMKEAVRRLFAGDSEVALLYFAGHGHIEETGGYLCGSECDTGDDGLALGEVLTLANESKAKNRIILLDSCHAGVAGQIARDSPTQLEEGLTILTASTKEQYSSEIDGSGVFTTLLIDALKGGAGNLVGDVTPGSVYAYIDQSLGPWQQRPVFKTNVKSFVSLRKVAPPIPLADLRRITEFFPRPGFEFQLDPTFEPERSGEGHRIPAPDPDNTEKFAVLQKLNRVNLVIPVGAPHMWHAAMGSKACRLTVIGEHYRRLVDQNHI